MVNLLPPDDQKRLRRSMRSRFIIVGAVASIAVACVAFLALVPSYLAVRYSTAAAGNTAATTSSTLDADRAQITEVQSLANQLRPFLVASTTPTQAILAALAEKPVGISLDSITYANPPSGASGQIVISATANSPDRIRAFQESLAKNPMFKSVSVPVGALVGTRDGRFTITLSGSF